MNQLKYKNNITQVVQQFCGISLHNNRNPETATEKTVKRKFRQ